MKHRVIIQPPAADDIDPACRWMAARNPDAAAGWFKRVAAGGQSRADVPRRCPLADENRAFEREIRPRVVDLRVGANRVLFTISGDSVQVLHVRHGRQKRLQPEKWKRGMRIYR